MQTSITLLLLGVPILGLRGDTPWSVPQDPAPRVLGPSGEQALPAPGLEDPLEALLQGSPASGRARLFADGSVTCSGVDDTSRPVGAVALIPKAGGIEFRLVLRLGASAANWPYYVELSQQGTCQYAQQFPFVLDGDGNLGFTGFYPTSPGQRSVLVDVVSDAGVDPPDPALREIATDGLIETVVPDDGTTLLTLGFDAGPGSLPWSEQGFTFSGNGTVSGQHLSMDSWGGFWAVSTVTLTRDSGGTFDAVALSADLSYLIDGWAWVESDLGGYQYLWAGPTLLEGPGWEGITTLYLNVWGFGDGGGWAAQLDSDDFVVRIPNP